MADVAVLGTVAADVVLRVPVLPRPGDHVSAEASGWRLGGSSANVAVGLAAAGHGVELIGPVGDDAVAHELLAELKRLGVRTDRAIPVAAPAPRALILLDAAGERTIVQLDRGSAVEVFPITDLPDLSSSDCVFVESYVRFPVSAVGTCDGALLVATPPDPGHSDWPADVLVGSEHQFPAAWRTDPFHAAQTVAGDRLQWVVVTRGGAGADAFGPDGSFHVAAPTARQVDATGAGDAFAAGLVCGLLEGRGMREAMELGVTQGAAAVEVLQSVPPSWTGCAAAP